MDPRVATGDTRRCRLTAPVSRLRHILVILLIVLAASPLTAPFATCDLLDLLDHDGSVSLTALKPPKTHDVVAAIASPRPLAHQPALVASVDADPATPRHLPLQVSLPLRL